jgi:hypothetical protein
MFLADIFTEFAASAFQPGVNRGLIVVLHASFILLLAVLMFLNLLTSFANIHVWALIGLSTGLYASVIWYYRLLRQTGNLILPCRFISEVYGESSEKAIPIQTRKGLEKTKKHI